jgi:hypothetical protein
VPVPRKIIWSRISAVTIDLLKMDLLRTNYTAGRRLQAGRPQWRQSV